MNHANARPTCTTLMAAACALASGGVLEIALPELKKDLAIKWQAN